MPSTTSSALPIAEALRGASERFDRAGLDDSRLLAEWLIADLTRISRPALRLDPTATVDTQALEAGVARLEQGEPLQYVLGHTPFMGIDLQVDARVLIPRPETEELVDQALDAVAGTGPLRVADVGTGSGCIAIQWANVREADEVHAFDCSPDALAVARGNALANRARIAFHESDLLDASTGAFHLVLANLPYIATDEMPDLPPNVRDHEPALALESGVDGLDAIRRLVPQAFQRLHPDGVLWLEIGETQGDRVKALMEQAGFRAVVVLPDQAGRTRFVRGHH